MKDERNTLVTGGSGLLGRELLRLLPSARFPPHGAFDIEDYGMMNSYLEGKTVKLLIHAAALTSPPRIDQDPEAAMDVNIVGTANVVRLCERRGIKLVYICTDYVFRGDRGNYSEEDPVSPVNKYAWSKLGGECAVRLYDNSLIIRTSFGANEFPYEKAFVDQWTSRLPVKDFAERLIALLETDARGVVHIGGPRRTVREYAMAVSPQKAIGELSLHDVSFVAPRDTSLNTSKYESLVKDPGRGS
jgi:dTDP-4-dehydrorhamnose reductase